MAHQCVHCGKLYENVSNEIIEGCSCGSHFFFFIKEQQYEKLKNQNIITDLSQEEKIKIEKDVRDIIGIREEEPVILDLESIRILEPGKFHIDIVRLFDNNRPLVYKLEEGKYIIDLASSFKKRGRNE